MAAIQIARAAGAGFIIDDMLAWLFSIIFDKKQHMIYRAIGIMSGSSLDGLDIAFVELNEVGGKWSYEIVQADCVDYSVEWKQRLSQAIHLNALDYQLLHTDFGHYIGEAVNGFIARHGIEHQVQLIGSHGHTTFHVPAKKMTGQLGDGAAIAATTGINVVSDLRAMDIALGGQGAPIVPMGEKRLLGNYAYFLNLGGIANISFNLPDRYLAFDTSPANRVLDLLIAEKNLKYDKNGELAASGKVNDALLAQLNALDYYQQPFPKSLANDFGTDVLLPIIQQSGLSLADKLCTQVEHVAIQLRKAIEAVGVVADGPQQMLACGGGAFNQFLVQRLQAHLQPLQIEMVVPDAKLVANKEALVMAFLAVLRWREENTVMHTVTGASRSSIGGAVWIGQNA
jgi:anhydro-N-acetylmuramic acid kinase